MPKKQPNDQVKIRRYLRQKNYQAVWEEVKQIGYQIIPDQNMRYMFFCEVVKDFRLKDNNNFIMFYRQRLQYYKTDELKTFYATRNRSIINKLKNEHISPTGDCENSRRTKHLKEWM